MRLSPNPRVQLSAYRDHSLLTSGGSFVPPLATPGARVDAEGGATGAYACGAQMSRIASRPSEAQRSALHATGRKPHVGTILELTQICSRRRL